jgi:hypothetical protein
MADCDYWTTALRVHLTGIVAIAKGYDGGRRRIFEDGAARVGRLALDFVAIITLTVTVVGIAIVVASE